MTAPTIAEMLKYSNLQMAAEALYTFDSKKTPNQTPGSLTDFEIGHYKTLTADILTDGNLHASRFTKTEADKFVQDWVVVDHLSNTTTGFSGTLFYNEADKQYVISIRSTEFVDDAARDSVATNNMEISTYGFAFGQIADMEAWYKSLGDKGLLPAGSQYSVTGYSLGGHLATAFNLLRHEYDTAWRVKEVVTFNGAGVGQVTSGTLGSVIYNFTTLRDNPDFLAAQFQDPRLGELCKVLSDRFKQEGHAPTSADYALLDTVTVNQMATEMEQQRFASEKNYIKTALDRIVSLKAEVKRLEKVTDSLDGGPAKIPDKAIAQEGFDYQMAVIWSSENTQSLSKIRGGFNTVFGKTAGSPFLDNQYDVAGRETTTTQTAMVADSQWHHGTNVDLFIEDQPLFRGDGSSQAVNDIRKKGTLNLNSEYSKNDFGDTHSLVLIVDSLNIQNTLLQLVPESERATQAGNMTSYLKSASALKADSNADQGKAEGDVLEWVLDGLVKLFTNTDSTLHDGIAENGDSLATGGTWSDKTLRKNFYDKLVLLNDKDKSAFVELSGKFTLSLPDIGLAVSAHNDFASLLSLITLSPVAIKTREGEEESVAARLGVQWGDAYSAWQKDKELSQVERGNGLANYTEHYLKETLNN